VTENELLREREKVLLSQANLVEIDLLRGGERLPVIGRHPTCDYVIIVSRRKTRLVRWLMPSPFGNFFQKSVFPS